MKSKKLSPVITPHEINAYPSLDKSIQLVPLVSERYRELVSVLEKGDWTVENCPAWGISGTGETAINQLKTALQEPSRKVRIEASKVLGLVKSKEAYKVLLFALESEHNPTVGEHIQKAVKEHQKSIQIGDKTYHLNYTR